MILLKNISSCWESTEKDIDDTPFAGILHVVQEFIDPANCTPHLDAVVIDPRLEVGAKVYWDNYTWRIIDIRPLERGCKIEIQRRKIRAKAKTRRT